MTNVKDSQHVLVEDILLNAMLMTDGYKLGHHCMYPKGMTQLFSNFTPRGNKYLPEATEGVVVFGIQYFIKKYLINTFNNFFFNLDEDTVRKTYTDLTTSFLGEAVAKKVGVDHIIALHKLGYLPIRIKALPEGVYCPIGCPVLTITNTHPDFAWLTNYLESILSNILWQPMTSATIADVYRRELVRHAMKTGFYNPNNMSNLDFLCHDFSMRGMSSLETTITSGMAHLTSFCGSESVPAIKMIEYYYNADPKKQLIAATVPACYTEDTEVLTDQGWKFFKDLDKTENIAQYSNDGTITFVKPIDYIKDRYIGDMIRFTQTSSKKFDIIVTPNHKMVVKTARGITKLIEASNGINKNIYNHSNHAIVSGIYNNETNNILSSIDKIKIAFQADGSFPSHKDDYNGKRTKKFPIRFSFKKERKKNRLIELCKDANVDYTLSYTNNYWNFWINMPCECVKDFSWVDIKHMSLSEREDFINELQFWDGTKKNNTIIYSSNNKQCIDIIQEIAILSGYATLIREFNDKRDNRQINYTINIYKSQVRDISNNIVSTEHYDGYVYCVTVPTHMIIVRRNNNVLICGNTEHSIECSTATNESGIPDDEIYFKKILDEFPEGIVSIVADGYDYWNFITKIVPKYKDQIMSRNGRVVIRPDSGDPVKIICGDPDVDDPFVKMGSYEFLWNTFGGTFNEKGYKVLDTHIGLLYGDSINMKRQRMIYAQLEDKKFAATNLILGIGSFSYQMNTRDQLAFACKATWCSVNGKHIEIYKDPKTVTGTPKKSHRGLLMVVKDENSKYKPVDRVTPEDEASDKNELKTVFEDGKLVREFTLAEIRKTRQDAVHKLLDGTIE